MDILPQLGVALGLASLSGVNLYLTSLLVGVAIRFDILHLAERYESLAVLGHTWIIAVAGVLFLLQFFADKIPLVDSLWDALHTFIRPVGGTLLALQALGHMPVYMQVVAALLAGGATLTTHGAKAGTRLLINHSPEPVTNVAMSVAEDAAVAGGVALTLFKPVIALVVFSGLIVVLWLIFPRMWRMTRSTIWLGWHKLKLPGRTDSVDLPLELKREIKGETLDLLRLFAGLTESDVAWTTRCLSGKAKGIRGLSANLDGTLIAPLKSDCVYFAAIKGWRGRLFKVPLEGAQIEVESKFLSENVILAAASSSAQFCFPRGQGDKAELVALRLRQMLVKTPPTMITHESEPIAEAGPTVPELVVESGVEATKPLEEVVFPQVEKVAPVPVIE